MTGPADGEIVREEAGYRDACVVLKLWSREKSILRLSYGTGCSLNIVFFPNYSKYSGLCFPLLSMCVHTTGR